MNIATNISRNIPRVNLVGCRITKTGKYIQAYQVNINNNIFTRIAKIIQFKFFKNRYVKKSVRIDNAMYNALYRGSPQDEVVISQNINRAVINAILQDKITLIKSSCFKHKVTVYLTPQEYNRVEKIINDIQNMNLSITFSSLVRSILYKELGLVTLSNGGLASVK